MKKFVFALLIFLWGGYDVRFQCFAEISKEGGQVLSNEIITLARYSNDIQKETAEVEQDTGEVQKDAYGNSTDNLLMHNKHPFKYGDNKTILKRSTSQPSLKKIASKLTAMIKEELPTKLPALNLKITARILEKIGRVKYLVPGDKDFVTSESLEIGTTVSLGQGLIGAAAGAAKSAKPPIAVAAGFFIFQVLKMGLDIGDAGGYGKMGTLEQYMKIQNLLDNKLINVFSKYDAKYPSQVGPLDKITKEEFKEKVIKEIEKMMYPGTNEPFLQTMWYKIKEDIKDNSLKESQIDNSAKMNYYLKLADVDKVLQKCFNSICIQLGGKLADRGHSDFRCSYKDKNSCESSYTYPLKKGDIYAEYKSKSGLCNHSGYILRTICEENHLKYDTDSGLCIITKKYCNTKAAEWKQNDKIGQMDCVIHKAQELFETVFGKTIVRGIKQIFDPRQYKPCNEGEFDDYITCRSVSCPAEEEQWKRLGICYPKCKKGFHAVGCCICSPDCRPGYTDDGLFCRKAGKCEPGQEKQALLCYPQCKEGYYGVGPVCWQKCPKEYDNKGVFCQRSGHIYTRKSRPADKKPCAKGLRDDGTSCWKDTYGRGAGRLPDKGPCPSGLRDDGISCWSDAHIYGKGCCCFFGRCCHNCRSGYTDDGCTCRKWDVGIKLTLFQRQTCKSTEVKNGALCYPKCKSGYHAVGCCLCEPSGGPGIRTTAFKRHYCNADEENVAGICWEKCKPGYTNDGLFCRDSFTKKSYGRGVGKPDIRIYRKPLTAYGRGAGNTAIHLRWKERKIPFSTKSNFK